MKKGNILGFGILTILFFCCSTLLHAQNKLEAKVDAQQIVIGDQIRYFITASTDTNQSMIRWTSIPDTFNSLECVERGKIDTSYQSSIAKYKQRILITGFDSGSFLIPRFLFLAYDRSGTIDSLFTDSFRIAVNTVAVDTSQPFKTIKNVVAVDSSWKDNLLLWLAVLLGLAVIAWVVYYFVKNKKNVVKSTTPVQEETLQERTLKLLIDLEERQLWQNDQVKAYYTELSEIVRHYIEQRFQTPAMELTTKELLTKAKKHKELALYRQDLYPLLEAADLAKFAKAIPLPEEHIMAMDLAKRFVQNSAPKAPQATLDNYTQNSPKQ